MLRESDFNFIEVARILVRAGVGLQQTILGLYGFERRNVVVFHTVSVSPGLVDQLYKYGLQATICNLG